MSEPRPGSLEYWARERPDAVALIEGERVLTWKALNDEADRVAHGLRRLGLEAGDVLFIDSSHMLRIGSDVQFEYLEILPRLKPGVIVHIHDIFLPAEYPRNWVHDKHIFWNEQYLLQAFLAFNASFEVLWGGSWMHLNHPAELESAFQSYKRENQWPGSFWIRRVQ